MDRAWTQGVVSCVLLGPLTVYRIFNTFRLINKTSLKKVGSLAAKASFISLWPTSVVCGFLFWTLQNLAKLASDCGDYKDDSTWVHKKYTIKKNQHYFKVAFLKDYTVNKSSCEIIGSFLKCFFFFFACDHK